MSDVATGEHRGAEVRGQGEPGMCDISKRLELLARQFAISSDRVFLRNSDAHKK